MGTFIKIFIMVAAIIGLATFITNSVPQQLTSNINGALIYFFSAIGHLGFLFHTDTIFTCLGIIVNFILAIATFYMALLVVKIVAK